MLPEKKSRKRAAYGLPPSSQAVVATVSAIQNLMSDGINLDGSLKPETIRALLKLRGINIAALAETNGVPDSFVHQVIDRARRNVDIENLISDCIGIPADQMWARRIA